MPIDPKTVKWDAPDPESVQWDDAPRSAGAELGRQVGLTGRAAVKGILALPGVALDAVTGLANTGADLTVGKGTGPRFRTTAATLDGLMTALGIAAPENATERVVQDAAGAMAGAGASSTAARLAATAAERSVAPVAKAVATKMAAGPGMQTIGASTGATAGGIARENDAPWYTQLAASLVGGAAPSLSLAAGSAGVRAAMRGGEQGRQTVLANIDKFKQAGTTPSVGQATEGRFPRAVESVLSKTPGGAGVMAAKGEAQASELGATADKLVASIAPRASAETAGRTISDGVKAFLGRFRAKQEDLYGAMDKHIPSQAPVNVSRTQAVLAELNSDIPGAPNLSQWFKNAKIGGIDRAMAADAGAARAYTPSRLKDAAGKSTTGLELDQALNEGTLPYEAIKKLRTLVGKEMDNPSLMADVPRSKWSALYAALSEDLGDTAATAGPQAKQAWSRANDFTRAGMRRLEVIDPVVGKNDPESIFTAAMSGTREGATRVRAVMQSLKPEEQNVVIGTVLRRMGLAKPGRQNELGDAFSSETFLTNWNQLSPESKVAIFGRPGAQKIAKQLQAMVGVASNVRDGSKVFANPSGTAPALSANMAGGGALAALATGNPATAAGILSVPLAANILARRMVKPDAVQWLGANTVVSPSMTPAQINAIGALFR